MPDFDVKPWGPNIPEFDDDQELEFGHINFPPRTFYLGRGLFADTNRVHRGIILRRPR